MKQDMLKGGIGNGIIGVISSDKEISFKVSTVLHNDDIYAVQVGNDFVDSTTLTVQKNFSAKLVSGKLAVPADITVKTGTTTVAVFDKNGKYFAGTFATGNITVTAGVEGAIYTACVPCDLSGSMLDLRKDVFPKSYYVELHTIAYDADTNQVVADIYWIFDKCLPTGDLTANYEAGKNNGDELNMTCQIPVGSNSYGKYFVVPRA